MAWTKAKTAIVVGVGVLLAVGTTTVAIKKFTPLSAEDVFKHPEDSYLEKAPPVVVLRPSSYGPGTRLDHMHGPPFSAASERFVELGQSLNWVISVAYDIGPERMILPPDMPMGKFDFLVAVPNNPKGALREEIKRQFGLVAHTEIQQQDVLVLKVVNPAAPNLKVNGSKSTDHGINQGTGKLALINFAMSGSERVLAGNDSRTAVVKTNIDDSIVNVLGGYYLGMPVIDETSLTESYDINLQWDGKLKWEDQKNAIEVALREQLGFEIIHTNMPIEVLVVEYQDGHQVQPPLHQASWAVIGCDTPEGAFQSGLAAMSKGDVQTYLATFTPDYRKRFMQTDAKGKSEGEIAAHIQHMAGEIAAFQIVSKELLSDDESVLYVRSTRRGNGKVTMKRIKGEWKFDEDIH